MKKLLIVVPCYNEEAVLPMTITALGDIINKLIEHKSVSPDSGVVFVNDGSRDTTWKIIKNAACDNPSIHGVNLAGNVGHQNALLAGLEYAMDKCDVTVSIDADLQDDVNVICDMVQKYLDGADIVFGVRDNRDTDSAFKRFTAQSFYKLMNFIGAKTVYNHADFRLMSSRSVKALAQYGERNLFLRGIVSNMGFSTDTVYYSRKERLAGESKYPLKKMVSFALDGITSFSIRPITFVTGLGFAIILCAIAAFIYTIASHLAGRTIAGWSSLMISIWFLGGVQLFSIGLVGQYVGKTYIESKRRPRYFIDETTDSEKNSDAH